MQRAMLTLSELLARQTPIRIVSRRKARVVNGQTSPERPRSGWGRIRYDRIHCAVDRYTDPSGSKAVADMGSDSCFIESRIVSAGCDSEASLMTLSSPVRAVMGWVGSNHKNFW